MKNRSPKFVTYSRRCVVEGCLTCAFLPAQETSTLGRIVFKLELGLELDNENER